MVHLGLRFEVVRKKRKGGIHIGWRVLAKRERRNFDVLAFLFGKEDVSFYFKNSI